MKESKSETIELKKILLEAGVSQLSIAQQLGLSLSHVSNVIQRRRNNQKVVNFIHNLQGLNAEKK